MALYVAPVARSRRASGRPVIAANGVNPVVARCVLLVQDGRGELQVAVRIEQITRRNSAVGLVADIDLYQPYIDARGRRPAQSLVQACAGCLPRSVSQRNAGNVQRPRPWVQLPADPCTALLQCHRIQYWGGHSSCASGQLIGWWRYFRANCERRSAEHAGKNSGTAPQADQQAGHGKPALAGDKGNMYRLRDGDKESYFLWLVAAS
ncbi:Uncharacterised protein [Serratia plymuthica]|nr:Uncharacterised protein [Serratia plymuthica]